MQTHTQTNRKAHTNTYTIGRIMTIMSTKMGLVQRERVREREREGVCVRERGRAGDCFSVVTPSC
jgi:hypothetical protein